jgi:hypothetical protein
MFFILLMGILVAAHFAAPSPAFDIGQEAFRRYRNRADCYGPKAYREENPFKTSSKAARDWHLGYVSAQKRWEDAKDAGTQK